MSYYHNAPPVPDLPAGMGGPSRSDRRQTQINVAPGAAGRRPQYARQASDDPSSFPGSSPAIGRSTAAGPRSTTRAQRRQTVRGAVRGTVRELGVDARLSMMPPTSGSGGAPRRALTRGKTLTRPERFVAPAPLINPGNAPGTAVSTTLVNGVPTLQTRQTCCDPWGVCVTVVTFWAPSFILSSCGLKDPIKQRAWKEKATLCSIALVMGGLVAFITIGLNRVLCPANGTKNPGSFTRLGTTAGLVGIQGWDFNATTAAVAAGRPNFVTLARSQSGQDVTNLFDRSTLTYPACASAGTAAYATTNVCTNADGTAVAECAFALPTPALFNTMRLFNTTQRVGYDWDQVVNKTNFLVLDGSVLNLAPYMLAHPAAIRNDTVDRAIRLVLQTLDDSGGKDATRMFYNVKVLSDAVPCLMAKYYAGHIDKVTPGCFVSQLFLYISLCLIMAIILARFAMACVFSWFLSSKLIKEPKNLKRHVISPAVLPEGANIDIGNTTGAAPWANKGLQLQKNGTVAGASKLQRRNGGGGGRSPKGDELPFEEKPLPSMMGGGLPLDAEGMISMASIGPELFAICLVTCYSEGEEGIKTTLDSIAGSTYSDARKLIFVVCDGMITGEGERRSTPDIVVGLMERDARFGEPQPMSYQAIAEGPKSHNQALVYAGHYTQARGHRTPIIVVVKSGTPAEAKDKKPGNRGKRDSQVILMNFISRVTYNDRMCPLDFDLFRKVHSLMGVTPDFFEVCLMVDADTKIYPASLGYMVRCMQNDSMIMGVCGETRIANKRQSWVTMIQVFEYFISHHLVKAFESTFGGVTCLPGCFSMYRLKARKANEGDWVPVLAQPMIVSEYSQSTVATLHQKNLLLLGEDRFLTTLMIRTFPNRKMMFLPQARCRTVAPDTFAVLLSQRRRWINSTVHNLMELVRVRNLCGTFCFSMQFIVFVDLVGTVVLPVAICLTYTLIVNYILNPPTSFSDSIPLLLLGAVLGLPAVLILLTTFKIVYVGWMLAYLVALPIWNFVLPVYAFSKFDDFSWGETRKVEGEIKGDDGHGHGVGGIHGGSAVPLRRWEDWEKSRLKKARREEKRRREFERQFGKQFHGLSPQATGDAGSTYYEDSVADSASMFSRDDDRWGMQIGGYEEDAPNMAPPPVGLYPVDGFGDAGEGEMDAREMELVLESGWGDEPDEYPQQGYKNALRDSVRYDGRPRGSPTPPPPRMYALADEPAMGSANMLGRSTSSLGHSGSQTNLFASGSYGGNSPVPSYHAGNSSLGHSGYGPGGGGLPHAVSSNSIHSSPTSAHGHDRAPLVSSAQSSSYDPRSQGHGHAKQRSVSGVNANPFGDEWEQAKERPLEWRGRTPSPRFGDGSGR